MPEYLVLLRLAEQYLIRAEARAHKGDVQGAVADLNVVRGRADLPELSPDSSQEECLAAVLRERRIELFGEWGHRFFDLKRLGLLNESLGEYKNTWVTTASAFPIPESEINHNPNLIQNGGY